MNLENPAGQLALIVSRLYELAANAPISEDQRQELLLLAHRFRGDMLTLVSMPFTDNTPDYRNAMSALSTLTNELDMAAQNIAGLPSVMYRSKGLADIIDELIKKGGGTNSTGPRFL
jgi:hypothetical protein